MKFIFAVLLIATGVITRAQSPVGKTVNMTIEEDDKTLSIQVDNQRNGRTVNYKRTFDIAGMSQSEKEILKNRVQDSLGVYDPLRSAQPPVITAHYTSQPPVSPTLPTDVLTNADQVTVTFCCEACNGPRQLLVISATDRYSIEQDVNADLARYFFSYRLLLKPGTYRLLYYQQDRVNRQSTFMVNPGKENTVIIK